jgi:phosphatidylserine/phosphatidylglycerophosphate/cardiolipin synthase-like enzyme
MIQGASGSLDFEEFYAVDKPGSRLAPVISAIEGAARRGVRVRFIADAGFAKKEPDTLARLEKMAGVKVVRIDWAARAGGGVQHAKFFIVDGRDAYLGSQNFDWRSLEHIQELGVRVGVPEVVRSLRDIFEADWAFATGVSIPPSTQPLPSWPVSVKTKAGPLRITFEAEPKGLLPDDSEWGLPKLVALIDSAKKSVRVQLLTYRTTRNGIYFDQLESALRRAGARGVEVQLLVSDWSKSPGNIEGLKSLTYAPGVAVKMITIPQWSGGFIPFARVAHAKFLSVDGERAWIGTSNWERDYFYQSRNVGLIVDGAAFAGPLDQIFNDDWSSPYSTLVDPRASYTPPRVGP